MFRNISIGVVVGLFAFLLSSVLPATQPFAFIFAAVGAVLSWFISFDADKQKAYSDNLRTTSIEAVEMLTKQQVQNANMLASKLDANLQAVNQVAADVKAGNKQQEVYLGEGLVSAISKIDAVCAKLGELVNQALKNNEDTAVSAQSAVKKVESDMSAMIEMSKKFVTESAQALASNSEEMIRQSLSQFSQVTASHHSEVNKAFVDAYAKASADQAKSIQQINVPIVDAVKDLNFKIEEISRETDELKNTIKRTLEDIGGRLEESSESASEAVKKYTDKMSNDVQDAIKSLSDDLTKIATKFTDYDKEMNIVQRLEKLCR